MSLPVVPDELDIQFYRLNNPDLTAFSDKELCCHYLQTGRAEGRPCSAAALQEFFIQIAVNHLSVLEIGPFFRPALIGNNIRYFDVLDTEGLRKRAQRIGFPQENIPVIHFVSPTGDLSVVSGTFQAVFSSHMLEHQPCIISHFKQVSQLLPTGGLYFLIIPDKRYCFDHYIAESTIADLIEGYYEQRTVHTVGSVIEHYALTTHNDPQRHWRGDHADPGFESGSSERVRSALERFNNTQGTYFDVHAWQFTPANFRSITTCLHELGFSTLMPWRVFDTPFGRQEFTAILVNVAT